MHYRKTEQEIALKSLELLSPERAVPYDQWLAVGMALHAAGCDIQDWINWHPDGTKNHALICQQKWEGFNSQNSQGVTIASLIQWAREDSGRDPFTDRGPSIPGEILDLEQPLEVTEVGGWNPAEDMLQYAKAVFRPGDKIGFVTNSKLNDKGKWVPSGRGVTGMDYSFFLNEIKTAGPVEAIGGQYERDAGVWVRINPLDGNGAGNKNVVDHRHVLVECDTMPEAQQLAIIEELNIPCAAIVNSGGKSIHAIVKVDAGDDPHLYRERVNRLFEVLNERGYEVDEQCRNPSRLSRLPGILRGNRRQFLVGTNRGAASWGEWEDYIERRNTTIFSVNQLLEKDFVKDDDSLIGNRFVCEGAAWIIVSRSGIGKSSLATQMAIHFAMGTEFFGLKPKRPLRSIIIQAENSELDMAEPVQGVIQALELGQDQIKQVNSNLSFIAEDTKFGDEFCVWLDRILTAYAPVDLVWVDPLLAYLGGDIMKQGEVSRFLRNGLNPIIRRHKTACCIIHHTAKVRKSANDDDWAAEYIGTGSSELTNWPRAVTVLEKMGDDPVTVSMIHPKRGNRLPRKEVPIQHSTDGKMRWIECVQTEEFFHEKACHMPPLKDSIYTRTGILRWLMDEMKINEITAKRFRDKWRQQAGRTHSGPWKRRKEDKNWLYVGRKFEQEKGGNDEDFS